MKKITALIGSAQKKATYEAVREFERNLKSLTEIELEYVFLADYQIEFCRGCKLCFNKGEKFCPLHDDRDVIIDKLIHSDGGNSILKYLKNMGGNLGYSTAKGCVLKTLEPVTKDVQKKNSLEIKKAAARFNKVLMRQTAPSPSFFRLMMFRMSRSGMKEMLNDEYYDYQYYRKNGWFESDYFYEVSLNPIKKLMGRIFDYIGHRMA